MSHLQMWLSVALVFSIALGIPAIVFARIEHNKRRRAERSICPKCGSGRHICTMMQLEDKWHNLLGYCFRSFIITVCDCPAPDQRMKIVIVYDKMYSHLSLWLRRIFHSEDLKTNHGLLHDAGVPKHLINDRRIGLGEWSFSLVLGERLPLSTNPPTRAQGVGVKSRSQTGAIVAPTHANSGPQ